MWDNKHLGVAAEGSIAAVPSRVRTDCRECSAAVYIYIYITVSY